jgi:hypothetical protein
MTPQEVVDGLREEWAKLVDARNEAAAVESQAQHIFDTQPNYVTLAAWHSAAADYDKAASAARLARIRLDGKVRVTIHNGTWVY